MLGVYDCWDYSLYRFIVQGVPGWKCVISQCIVNNLKYVKYQKQKHPVFKKKDSQAQDILRYMCVPLPSVMCHIRN